MLGNERTTIQLDKEISLNLGRLAIAEHRTKQGEVADMIKERMARAGIKWKELRRRAGNTPEQQVGEVA